MIYKKILFYVSLAAILVLAVIPHPDRLPDIARLSDKLNHFAAFLVLAALIDLCHPEKRWVWKILFLGGYGIGIEVVQLLIPYRDFSLGDMGADLAGATVYFMLKSVREMIKRGHTE